MVSGVHVVSCEFTLDCIIHSIVHILEYENYLGYDRWMRLTSESSVRFSLCITTLRR